MADSRRKTRFRNIDPAAAKRIRDSRKNKFSGKQLLEQLITGDKTALGRAITLVESHQKVHQEEARELIEAALPFAQNSLRIGITGVPGVGKSSFIESLGCYLVEKGKKVAVLAVDPSSTISKGSILGDKTRMEHLAGQPKAFIRPSPSGDSLGGVARRTRESILLCEAAGFEVILVETVGVGQSETTVHSMTDFFLLLKLSGAGDQLQGIKRGIIEMADAIIINKADGDNLKAAREAKMEFQRALDLYPPKTNGWQPKVDLSSALEGTGIKEIWDMIRIYEQQVKQRGYFEKNRVEQRKFWMYETINQYLKKNFYADPRIKTLLEEQLMAIAKNKVSAYAAAAILIKKYQEG